MGLARPRGLHTNFPGARQIDRAAFRRIAREVGSLDEDIIGQVGGGGVESRSRCALTTELHSHAPGLCAQPDAADKAVDTELAEEWALGPFYHPPTVPIRALPRDVIQQQRSRVLADGEVEDYQKSRILAVALTALTRAYPRRSAPSHSRRPATSATASRSSTCQRATPASPSQATALT